MSKSNSMMQLKQYTDKTKEQLVGELDSLRQRVVELEQSEAEYKRMEEEIRRKNDTQTTINSLLSLSLENIPLEGILKRAVELILSIPWLTFESRGSLFLVEDDPYVLVMKAQSGLAEPIRKECARVPFGRCLCGRAALTGEIEYADCLNEHHETRYEGITPHGHYCTPILFAGKVIGVINMYLREGHCRDQGEEEFLNAIADVLAGVIERKQVEDKIRQAAEDWRITFNSIADSVSILDKDFKIVRVNEALSDYLGMEPAELIGKTCYEVMHRTKEPPSDCPHKQTLETKKQARSEMFIPHLGVHLEVSASPIFDDKGELVGSVHITKDITERKQAEEAQRESEERYRALFDSTSDIVQSIAPDGSFIFVNKAWFRVLGYTEAELPKLNMFNIIHPESRKHCQEIFARVMAGESVHNVQATFITKDGKHIQVEGSASPRIIGGSVIATQGFFHDVTERKKMEEQLILTDRLVSIGELASGIAHELNNPLTGVIGFSELLLEKDVPNEIREDIAIVHNEAIRAANVVKNLLTFARKHTPSKQLVNINSVIASVLGLRAYEQKVNNIQVVKRLASDMPEVLADSFQLQQVFLNIVINAEYFMEQVHRGGVLTIITEREGDIIRITFTDDGPGIREETLGHIFDPFFTTKEVGKGTGLGLSICHGIITEHGGRIYAWSKLGKGASFIIELPISRDGKKGEE